MSKDRTILCRSGSHSPSIVHINILYYTLAKTTAALWQDISMIVMKVAQFDNAVGFVHS